MMTVNSLQEAKPALLIDASIFIFQYYFSLPDNWYSEKESWPTAAVYGYSTFLIRLLSEQRPQRIAACFDESLETCFRNNIYPDYKCSRALPDEALAFQLSACRRVTELLGINTYGSKTHEADDLLGSLYQRLIRSPVPIAVLTRDKDLGQLLKREQDFLWDYLSKSGLSKGSLSKDNSSNINAVGKKLYSKDIQQKFGVSPDQMIDFLALVGDTSDDIPGVPGIGNKTAQALLAHYGSIQHLLSNIETLPSLPIRGAKTLGIKILEYQEQIQIAQQLATIVVNLPLIKSISELTLEEPEWTLLEEFCISMGFPKLFQRMKILEKST